MAPAMQIYIKSALAEGPVKQLSSLSLTLYLNFGQGLIAFGKQTQAKDIQTLGTLMPHLTLTHLAVVVTSCIFGIGISFFGFSVRRRVSATAFTVLGSVNKMLSICIDIVQNWGTGETVSTLALVSLTACIAGGLLYSLTVIKDGATRGGGKS